MATRRVGHRRPLIFKWYDETGLNQLEASNVLGVTRDTLRLFERDQPIPKKYLLLMEAVRRGIGPYTGRAWARKVKAGEEVMRLYGNRRPKPDGEEEG